MDKIEATLTRAIGKQILSAFEDTFIPSSYKYGVSFRLNDINYKIVYNYYTHELISLGITEEAPKKRILPTMVIGDFIVLNKDSNIFQFTLTNPVEGEPFLLADQQFDKFILKFDPLLML